MVSILFVVSINNSRAAAFSHTQRATAELFQLKIAESLDGSRLEVWLLFPDA